MAKKIVDFQLGTPPKKYTVTVDDNGNIFTNGVGPNSFEVWKGQLDKAFGSNTTDKSPDPKTKEDILGPVEAAVNQAKQALADKDKKDAAVEAKAKCPCPSCFDKYVDAITSLIGNITKVLDNSTIQTDGCPRLGGGADEPGCLKAPYRLGSSTDRDASAVQPNNKNSLAQNSDVAEQAKKMLEELYDKLNITMEEFKRGSSFVIPGTGPAGDGDITWVTGTNFGLKDGKKWSMEHGTFRYTDKAGKLVTAKGGCKGIIDLWSRFQENGANPPTFRDDFIRLPNGNRSPYNERLATNFNKILEFCCKVKARELFDEPESLGQLGNLADYKPKLPWPKGGSTGHCAMGSGAVFDLQKKPSCCVSEQLCPNFNCDEVAANVAEIDRLKSSLQQISNRSSGSTCINELVDQLRSILYGAPGQPDTGLYNRLMRFMIIDSIIGDNFRRNADGTPCAGCNPLNDFFPPFTGGGLEACSDKIMSPLNPNPPNEGTAIWDAAATWLNDSVLMNTHTDLLNAHGPSTTAVKCEIPVQIDIPITSIKLPGSTIDLATQYNELISQLQTKLREAVAALLEGITAPEFGSTDEERARCDQAKQTLKTYKDSIRVLKDDIADLQQQMTDLDSQIADLDKEIARAPSPREERPSLPTDPDVSTKTGCGEARSAYETALAEEAAANRVYDASKVAAENAAHRLTILNANKSTYKSAEATLSGVPASKRSENVFPPSLSGTIPPGTTTPETWNQFSRRLAAAMRDVETKIREQEATKTTTDNNLQTAKTALDNARKKLASAGERVKKLCKYPDTDFNPITPSEAEVGSRKQALEQAKEKLLETKANLYKTINQKTESLTTFESILPSLERDVESACGSGAVSLETCFFNCIREKAADLIDDVSALRLKRWDTTKKECDDFSPIDGENPTVSPDGTQGDWVFNVEVQASKFAENLTEIVEECLAPKPVEGGEQDATDCDFIKTTLDDVTAKLTKASDAVLLVKNGLANSLSAAIVPASIDLNILNSASSLIVSLAQSMDARNGFVPTMAERAKVDALIATLPSTISDSDKIRIKSGIYQTLSQLRTVSITYNQLEKDKEFLTKALEACQNLKKNTHKCNTLLVQIAPTIRERLGQNQFASVWNDFIELAKSLYDPDAPGSAPGRPNMQQLREQVEQYIKDYVAKICPDVRDVDKLNWPDEPWGGYDPDGPGPATGQPMPGPKVPFPTYQPIEPKHISIICKDGRWDVIRVLVYLNRQAYWESTNPMNNFWNYVTDLLNRTVLCRDPDDCDSRASIMHDLWTRYIEGWTSPPVVLNPNIPGPKRSGPRWAPQLASAPCNEGPYYFPPPNDFQVKQGQVNPPCPNHCTHLPHPPDPQQRFSLLRRMYYEMSSALEYFTNIENLVDNTVATLDNFKNALEFCSNKSNNGKEYIDTPDGQNSKLNPSNHSDPRDPSTALIKASLGTKCECKDLLTGDGGNTKPVENNPDAPGANPAEQGQDIENLETLLEFAKGQLRFAEQLGKGPEVINPIKEKIKQLEDQILEAKTRRPMPVRRTDGLPPS